MSPCTASHFAYSAPPSVSLKTATRYYTSAHRWHPLCGVLFLVLFITICDVLQRSSIGWGASEHSRDLDTGWPRMERRSINQAVSAKQCKYDNAERDEAHSSGR